MASGADRPGYRQVSDEDHATFKIAPSGCGVEDYPNCVTARGECFETELETNGQFISISNDSASPAFDGDAPSLVRSRTPQLSTDQPISWFQVCESSNLLPFHGITENTTNINENDAQFTSLSQQFVSPSTPNIRSPIRRNASPVFNDNVLFGNGSDHFDGSDNQASRPERQSFMPNVFSTTNEYVLPTTSRLYAFSGQDVSFSGSYVLPPAPHSPQVAQTTRMIPPNNTMIPLYRAPISHIRFDVPSSNWDQFRPPYSMPTSSLSVNQGVPYPWQSNPYVGPRASSTFGEQYQHQRASTLSNPHSARGVVSQNAGTVFISQHDKLSRWSLTTTVIMATDACGRRYKLHQVFKPELAQYGARLQTFVNWPSNSHITPQEAASAGFYLENEGYTRCFACSGGLEHWQPGDNAFKEHAKFYQTCPYVNAVVMEQYLESAGGGREREGIHFAPGRNPPVETPMATGCSQKRAPFDKELNTYCMQLIQMGFQPSRVKLVVQRTMEKYGKEKFGLDELLDNLNKTDGEETSEDDPEVSPFCINDVAKNCAVS